MNKKFYKWLKNKRLAIHFALVMQVGINDETICNILEKGVECLHITIKILDSYSKNIKYLCLTIEIICFVTGFYYESASMEIIRSQIRTWTRVSKILKRQYPQKY